MTKSNENETERPEVDLSATVAACRGNGAAMAELAQIYARVDAAVERLAVICLGGGACCKFDLFDHRLYATTAELAMLSSTSPPDLSRAKLRRCPYQVGPACYAYNSRPLGCRTFFCNSRTDPKLGDLYEDAHEKIRNFHEVLCIPYVYAELTASLPQLLVQK